MTGAMAGMGSDGWGARSALGATAKALEDLGGNRDGLWDNESKPAFTVGDVFSRQPLLVRGRAALSVGRSRDDEVQELTAFRREAEAGWGTSVLDPEMGGRLRAGALYGAEGGGSLPARSDPGRGHRGLRSSCESVGGAELAPRDVFFQHWAPKGVPSER